MRMKKLIMPNDKRSEFKELELAAKQLLATKIKNEEESAAARLTLQALLNILTDCKLRRVMPPFGLLEIARHLANKFPGLDDLLEKINNAEREIVQAISEKTDLSPAYLRDFEKWLVKDPYKAAEAYFEDKRIEELNKTIDLIEQGKTVPIPEFVQYIKTLEEEKDRRDRLAPALAIQLKMRELQGETDSPKITKTKEWLGKLGTHKIHAVVCKKHKERRIERELPHDDETIAREDQHLIVRDVRELKDVLAQAKIALQDVAIIPEEVIEKFAKTRDTEKLKEEIVIQQAVIVAAAIEKRDEVVEIATVKKAAAKALDIQEEKIDIKQDEQQAQTATAGDYVDMKAQVQAGSRIDDEMDDFLSGLDEEPDDLPEQTTDIPPKVSPLRGALENAATKIGQHKDISVSNICNNGKPKPSHGTNQTR